MNESKKSVTSSSNSIVSENGEVKLTIKRKTEYDEWQIRWNEKDGADQFKYDENKTGYESTKEDAVETMMAMISHYDGNHPIVKTLEINVTDKSVNTSELTVSEVQAAIKLLQVNLDARLSFPDFEKIFISYVRIRMLGNTIEWGKRFQTGYEWQYSDFAGRQVLQGLAPKVYPTELDTYFVRTV